MHRAGSAAGEAIDACRVVVQCCRDCFMGCAQISTQRPLSRLFVALAGAPLQIVKMDDHFMNHEASIHRAEKILESSKEARVRSVESWCVDSPSSALVPLDAHQRTFFSSSRVRSAHSAVRSLSCVHCVSVHTICSCSSVVQCVAVAA